MTMGGTIRMTTELRVPVRERAESEQLRALLRSDAVQDLMAGRVDAVGIVNVRSYKARCFAPDGRFGFCWAHFNAASEFEDSEWIVTIGHELAHLSVGYKGAPALPLGTSSELVIGTAVAVLGYPLNQSFERLGFRSETPTLVQGVVAARQAYRPTPLSQPIRVLQIDANPTPGHSSGAVFLRSAGEVVDIANSAIMDTLMGRTDVCFAVSIDVARGEIGER